MLTEFDLIQHFFSNAVKPRSDVVLGIGDDCAIVDITSPQQLAVSIDTLVSGVHFPIDTTPSDIGYKSLAVNLSDLAAMGASPAWVTLALTLPRADPAWLEGFCEGFFSLANAHDVTLIGGDTTRGPLSITIQAHGLVPKNTAITRSGAAVGDLIYVTHTLGDAGLALAHRLHGQDIPFEYRSVLLNRLNRPTPRVREGLRLRGIANAMIDISDGLVADLGHILEQSDVSATVYIEKIPLSTALLAAVCRDEAYRLALTAGDDYELCFTVPPHKKALLENECADFAITCIGEITAHHDKSMALNLRYLNGESYPLTHRGYLHF